MLLVWHGRNAEKNWMAFFRRVDPFQKFSPIHTYGWRSFWRALTPHRIDVQHRMANRMARHGC